MNAETSQNRLILLLKESVARQQDEDADKDDNHTEVTENKMEAPLLKKKLIGFIDCVGRRFTVPADVYMKWRVRYSHMHMYSTSSQ
jgi:hypothetical protein